MNERTVLDKICIEAKYIGPNIIDTIRSKIQKKMNSHCDQEHGYVIEAGGDIQILDNTISSTGSGVFFKIQFKIHSLKPTIGDTFKGKVIMILENGIIIEVEKLMKVFISKEKMCGYKYSNSKQIFKKDSYTIKINDIVETNIEDIEYEKKNFNCIGSLKDR